MSIVEDVHGYFERADREFITGWAARLERGAFMPAKIDILVDGDLRWSGLSDVFRGDLLNEGLGDGCLSFAIPSGTLDGLPRSECAISVLANGQPLNGGPRVMPAAEGSDLPVHVEIAEPRISGCLDEISGSVIRGWAFDAARPLIPVSIDILVDGQFALRTTADLYRADLMGAGFGTGHCAFIAHTPLTLFDGKPHIVKAIITNSSRDIYNSPTTAIIQGVTPLHHIDRLQSHMSNLAMDMLRHSNQLKVETNNVAAATKHVSNYIEWAERYVKVTVQHRENILKKIALLRKPPRISILMPTYNTDPSMLKAAIESVRSQLYPHWQLCVADDNSTSKETLKILKNYASADARINVTLRTSNGHISEATNTALASANGEYIALLDHDDVLTEDALAYMALAINETNADLLYSDEDKIDNKGTLFEPHFKPAFNYTLLLSNNYICHFLVARTSLARKVGGFRTITNGSQDHDITLRMIENIDHSRIVHIPRVLYHWRVHEASTALSTGAKSYVIEAGVRAVTDHLNRVGQREAFVTSENGYYNVKWPLPEALPLVSVIIPTRDCADVLGMCIVSLFNRTDYANIEIIIVDNGSEEEKTFSLFNEISKDRRVTIVKYDKDFNYSDICNFGFSHSRGDLVLMLNNDIEAVEDHRDWLSLMVAQISRDNVGAVGAKLLYPNGHVQHGGIVIGMIGLAGHANRYLPNGLPGYFNRLRIAQELSGCTAACLLIRRSVFIEMEGFDSTNLPVSFNDVDICLRIREAGYKIIYEPAATLVHHESYSRGPEDTPSKIVRAQREIAFMKDRWGHVLDHDPAYSPSLTLAREDFSIDIERGPGEGILWRTGDLPARVEEKQSAKQALDS